MADSIKITLTAAGVLKRVILSPGLISCSRTALDEFILRHKDEFV